MKRFICYLLILSLLLSCSFSVWANIENEILVEAESYTDYHDTTKGNMYSQSAADDVDIKNGIVTFDQNEWLEYKVTVTKAGLYSLTFLAGTKNDSTVVTVIMMEKEVLKRNLESTGNMNTLTELALGNIALSEGENIIRFLVSGRVCNFDNFKLAYVGEAMTMLEEENTVEAESADDFDGTAVSEGTGSAVVFEADREENYTLGAYVKGVYNLGLNLKGNGLVSLSINDECIIAKEVNSSEYKTVDFGNILFYEGKNILTLKVSDGIVNVDFLNISLFNPDRVTETEEILIPVESYTRKEGNMTEGRDSAGKRYISFNAGRILEYDITLPKSGLYQVVVYSAIGPDYTIDEAELEIVAGDKSAKGKSYKTSNWYDYQPFTLCGMILDAGDVTLKIKGASGASHINSFVLKYIGEGIKLNGVVADNISVATNVTIPRGTDKFTVFFNAPLLADSLKEENVQILSNGENIPLKLVSSEKNLEINLLKTLDFNAEINLYVSGIKDETGQSEIDTVEYTLYTDGDYAGDGYLSDIVASNIYEDITVTGHLYSGNGYKMQGRKVEMHVVYPDGTAYPDPVQTVLSGENGFFEISYSLPENSADGIYCLKLYAEYSDTFSEVKIGYMKKSTETSVLSELSKTDKIEDAKKIIKDNATVLGLKIEEDINIFDIPDESAFYNHFVGQKYDTKEDLISDYDRFLLLEKINQASSENKVEEIITDKESIETLGLSVERINYLVDKRQQMIKDIFDLDSIADIDEFISVCEVIIEKNIAIETGTQKAYFITENITTTENGGVSLNIETDIGYNEVKEAVFEILFDSNEFSSPNVVAVGNHNIETQQTANGIKVIVKPKWSLGETKKYATVYLTAPAKSGTYNIDMSGVVCFNKKYYPSGSSAVSQLDVSAYIESKTLNVTVNKNQAVSGGSTNHGTSHTPSGGGLKGSGGGSAVKPIEPVNPVNPPKDDFVTKEVFADLSNVEWAKESIYNLVKKGVISEADNFYPNRNVTREEFVKMLVVALGKYDETLKSNFDDVNNDAWYAPYIASAQNANIVSGDDENNFGVGKEITRQDMSVMIYRALSLDINENAEKFSDDENISDYAKDAVYKMRALGIINGVGDNMFAPKIPASRAMAAKIINAMLMEVVQ